MKNIPVIIYRKVEPVNVSDSIEVFNLLILSKALLARL